MEGAGTGTGTGTRQPSYLYPPTPIATLTRLPPSPAPPPPICAQADSQATTTKWVALPQWKALALARHPVAVPLVDCAADPAVLAASRAKVCGF
jgi:hypothetical protein